MSACHCEMSVPEKDKKFREICGMISNAYEVPLVGRKKGGCSIRGGGLGIQTIKRVKVLLWNGLWRLIYEDYGLWHAILFRNYRSRSGWDIRVACQNASGIWHSIMHTQPNFFLITRHR